LVVVGALFSHVFAASFRPFRLAALPEIAGFLRRLGMAASFNGQIR
jgi:hypothetical protein